MTGLFLVGLSITLLPGGLAGLEGAAVDGSADWEIGDFIRPYSAVDPIPFPVTVDVPLVGSVADNLILGCPAPSNC